MTQTRPANPCFALGWETTMLRCDCFGRAVAIRRVGAHLRPKWTKGLPMWQRPLVLHERALFARHSFSSDARSHSFFPGENCGSRTLEEVMTNINSMVNRKHVSFSSSKPHGDRGSSVGLTTEELLSCLRGALLVLPEPRSPALWTHQVFVRFLSTLESRLYGMSATECFRLLGLFARNGYCPPKLLGTILAVLKEDLKNLSVAQLSQLPVVLSRLGIPSQEKDTLFIGEYCGEVSSRCLMTREVEDENESQEGLGADGIIAHEDFGRREISFVLLGFSSMGCRPLQFLHSLVDTLLKIITHNGSGEVQDGESLVVEGQQYASILLSLSTLGIKHPTAYQVLTRLLSPSLEVLPPSSLANVVLFLSTLCRDTDFSFPVFFAQELETALERRCLSFGTSDSLAICWGLCCIGIHKSRPRLIVELLRQVESNHRQDRPLTDESLFTEEELFQISQVLLTLKLDFSLAPEEIKKELEQSCLWPLMTEATKRAKTKSFVYESPIHSSDVAKQVEELLQDGSLVRRLIQSFSRGSLDSVPYRIVKDMRCLNLYTLAICLLPQRSDIQPGLLNKDCKTTVAMELPCEKPTAPSFFIEVDDNAYEDFEDTLDTFTALKVMHLKLAGWTVVRINGADWRRLPDKASREIFLLRAFKP